MGNFFQDAPELKSEYTPLFREVVRQMLAKDVFLQVDVGLSQFGQRCLREVKEYGDLSEAHPPVLKQFSPWGVRIDEIQVHPSWEQLHGVAAEEGLIATGYERRFGEYSRLVQYAKLFLFHPSSAFYSCPLAMTDGAARILETLTPSTDVIQSAFSHLTTRDPLRFWTSGQWMTEKEGGSDVSRTSTTATPTQEESVYLLNGVKWFSSATTAQMALALARIQGAPEGSRGLSLFYVPLRKEDGHLNGIRVMRLKDKLGTKALPTAELQLEDCRALLVGEPGHGVKSITKMLNITRMHNAICSSGQMARSINLAQSFAEKRFAFGDKVINHPLHKQVLGQMHLKLLKSFSLTLQLALWMGKEECGTLTEDESHLLRLLTPVAKLYTARLAVEVATSCIECFGGAGYVEDTGVPLMLRNAQVFPIWEGTTNILSLDVLRVAQKDPQVFETYFSHLTVTTRGMEGAPVITQWVQAAKDELQECTKADLLPQNAVNLANLLAEGFCSALATKLHHNSEHGLKSVFGGFLHLMLKDLPSISLYGWRREDQGALDSIF